MDRLSGDARIALMRRIKTRNTSPEIAVRKMLHNMGLRFRLHAKNLPGTPGIVLPKYKTAIFVHGCFWHRHKGCKRVYMPMINTDYWVEKFNRNVERDKRVKLALSRAGWKVLVIWEYETARNRVDKLYDKLSSYFSARVQQARQAEHRLCKNVWRGRLCNP